VLLLAAVAVAVAIAADPKVVAARERTFGELGLGSLRAPLLLARHYRRDHFQHWKTSLNHQEF
jgi:hypothetical protein